MVINDDLMVIIMMIDRLWPILKKNTNRWWCSTSRFNDWNIITYYNKSFFQMVMFHQRLQWPAWFFFRRRQVGDQVFLLGNEWLFYQPLLLSRKIHMGMDQYLLIPFLRGWTSIYQLFWCSPGVQGFDTLPHVCDCLWLHILDVFDVR